LAHLQKTLKVVAMHDTFIVEQLGERYIRLYANSG